MRNFPRSRRSGCSKKGEIYALLGVRWQGVDENGISSRYAQVCIGAVPDRGGRAEDAYYARESFTYQQVACMRVWALCFFMPYTALQRRFRS